MTVDMFYPVTDWDAPPRNHRYLPPIRHGNGQSLPSKDGCPTVFPWFSPDFQMIFPSVALKDIHFVRFSSAQIGPFPGGLHGPMLLVVTQPSMRVSQNGGTSNGWFIVENPI